MKSRLQKNLHEPNRLPVEPGIDTSRMFGGIRFYYYGTAATKTEARRIAEKVRTDNGDGQKFGGCLARVVPIERGHLHPWIKQGQSVHKKNFVIYFTRKSWLKNSSRSA